LQLGQFRGAAVSPDVIFGTLFAGRDGISMADSYASAATELGHLWNI
jgi:hypothetical protein